MALILRTLTLNGVPGGQDAPVAAIDGFEVNEVWTQADQFVLMGTLEVVFLRQSNPAIVGQFFLLLNNAFKQTLAWC